VNKLKVVISAGWCKKLGCAKKMLDWRREKPDEQQKKAGKSPHRESALYSSE
jgi:hypothetical protein